VRAAAPAPAPARVAPSRPAALSLADYLRERARSRA
jgi:hypothetical protein